MPVRDASTLAGANVHVHVDAAARREVAKVLSPSNGEARDECARRAAAPVDYVRAAELSAAMVAALAKAIGQDVETARFYMEEAGGDVRRARAAVAADKEWNDRNPAAAAAAKRVWGGEGGGGGEGGLRPQPGRGRFGWVG